MSSQGPLPYLVVNGGEVANAARTVEYLRRGLADTSQGRWILGASDLCSILYRVPGDCAHPLTYLSPAADPAPWYDALIPSSAKFLGLVLLDLSGYDSTVTRTVTNKIQGLGGASFSGQRRNPRTWKFRAAMISATDAGAEYGLRWLRTQLAATSCDSCSTGNLTVRLVCPPDDCSDETLGEWTSYDVVLTEGPTEVERWAPRSATFDDTMAGCRDVVVVEWTMVAGNPFLYKPPVACLAEQQIGENVVCTKICEFLFGDPGPPHCCAVAPPEMGTIAPIYTFLAPADGMGSILLEAYEGSCFVSVPSHNAISDTQVEANARTGWTQDSITGGDIWESTSSGGPHAGSYHFHVVNNSDGNRGFRTDGLTLIGGVTYHLSGWYKHVSGAVPRVYFGVSGGDEADTLATLTSATYASFTLAYTPTVTTHAAYIRVLTNGHSGEFYVDDFLLGPATPPQLARQMQIDGVPGNGYVIVDCAQRKITVGTPDGSGGFIETDGTGLLVLDDYVSIIQWIESRDCDEITCFCARYAHPCSQGDTTTVSISTQLREG